MKEKAWETWITMSGSCGQQSVQMACFLTSKHVLRADQFHITVFRKLNSRDLLKLMLWNTLKGSVEGSSGKEEFVQQWEMPKKAMSGKGANRNFLCSSKTQEWHSWKAAFFPSAEKIPVLLCPDSPRCRCREHPGWKFHLPWRGWNPISCDYRLWCWLGCQKRAVQWYDVQKTDYVE